MNDERFWVTQRFSAAIDHSRRVVKVIAIYCGYRNKSLILSAKPYENPAAPISSSDPKHLTAHVGRRLQGSVVCLRNDSGLRKSPTPHQTYATAQTRKKKGLSTGAKRLHLLWNGSAITTARQLQKITQPVNDSALRLRVAARRWNSAKKCRAYASGRNAANNPMQPTTAKISNGTSITAV